MLSETVRIQCHLFVFVFRNDQWLYTIWQIVYHIAFCISVTISGTYLHIETTLHVSLQIK